MIQMSFFRAHSAIDLSSASVYTDLVGIDSTAARHGRELLSYAAAQFGDSYVRRVPRHSPLNGLNTGLRSRSRRVEVGLPYPEVEHILAGSLPALGFVADGHGFGSL